MSAEKASKNIVETAAAAEVFGRLMSAVDAADLVDTLSGEGPFTVFAPTDDAFGRLPESTISGLFNDTEALTRVLKYHVVNGKLDAADLLEKRTPDTVNGAIVNLDQLSVTKANVQTANGIIHIIDEVLLPPSS